MNLEQETRQLLKRKGYAWGDVSWVGSGDGHYACGIGYFLGLANKDYDAGFGSQQVAKDLVMVMRDGSWFERHEYDGSECWQHVRPPVLGGRESVAKQVVAMDKIWLEGESWYTVHQAMVQSPFACAHWDDEGYGTEFTEVENE